MQTVLPADEAATIIQKHVRGHSLRHRVLWNPATEAGLLWVTAAMQGRLPLLAPQFADAEPDSIVV